jgi:hypothetical protein
VGGERARSVLSGPSWPAVLLAAVLTAAWTAAPGAAPASAAAPEAGTAWPGAPKTAPEWAAAGADPADQAIRQAQDALVEKAHSGAIALAGLAVGAARAALDSDTRALSAAESSAAAARSALAAAASKLSSDRAALAAAGVVREDDRAKVAADRAGMGVIAVALYTGETTSLQPSTLHALETDQQAVIEAGEVESVAAVLGDALRSDLAAAARADRRWDRLSAAVAADRTAETRAARGASSSSARAALEESVVTADQQRLAAADGRLAAADAALQADLASVAGPPAGGMSVLGGSALSAAQLAGWYQAQGYADLTPTPISQLAAWYVQDGQAEGVRGDVAFAQAVLETGGFSSPDSVELSNFAGIGHCDSCSAGWAFPSPQAGVLGQVQLLRIWAGAGYAPGGPAPALPAITPQAQGESGCCSTWESLTGVWATDPYYGAEILGIYQQILGWALGRG